MAEARLRRVMIVHSVNEAGGRDVAVDQVASAIARLGHQTDAFAVVDDLDALASHLGKWRPDLVVNLVEQFAGNPLLAPDMAAALELFQVPFTGAGPAGLYLARDLALARRLLASHGVPVVAEGSGGPEAVVAVVGNDPGEVLVPARIPAAGLVPLARASAAALRLRDYALLVVRPSGADEVAIVRPVPNPRLGREEELARVARQAGWSYEDLLRRILDEAWARREEAARQPAAQEPE